MISKHVKPAVRCVLPILHPGPNSPWVVPMEETEFIGFAAHRTVFNFRGYTYWRLVARKGTFTVAGAQLKLQYSLDGGSTWADGCSVSLDVSNIVVVGAWVLIPANAKGGDVLVRLVGVGGDGTTSFTFNQIVVQLR